jgi:hypothetical protein
MIGYNVHTNKVTKPTQNIEFMQKNDYETLETLILNIVSNTHLKMKSKPPSPFSKFLATVRTNSHDSLCPDSYV